MQTTVRFRAYPTPAQQVLWAKHAGACRVVFNLCLRMTLDLKRERGVWVDDKAMSAQLTELRNDPDTAPWLRETPLQQAVRQPPRVIVLRRIGPLCLGLSAAARRVRRVATQPV